MFFLFWRSYFLNGGKDQNGLGIGLTLGHAFALLLSFGSPRSGWGFSAAVLCVRHSVPLSLRFACFLKFGKLCNGFVDAIVFGGSDCFLSNNKRFAGKSEAQAPIGRSTVRSVVLFRFSFDSKFRDLQ